MACRLRVYDTSLCLLSAHLSSGENEGDELKRNYDYSEIVRRGAFPADVAAVDPAAALPGQQQDGIAKVRGTRPSVALVWQLSRFAAAIWRAHFGHPVL